MQNRVTDRRQAPRSPLTLAAEILAPNATPLKARCSDVSCNGCYIDTLNPLPLHSDVRLRLMRGEDVFEVYGTVAYYAAGLGMGIRFDAEMPAQRRAILTRWLKEAEAQG